MPSGQQLHPSGTPLTHHIRVTETVLVPAPSQNLPLLPSSFTFTLLTYSSAWSDLTTGIHFVNYFTYQLASQHDLHRDHADGSCSTLWFGTV